MKIALRATTALVFASGLCGGLLAACPDWAEEIGADDWFGSASRQELRANQRELARTRASQLRVGKRLELKQIIIDDVISGRLDLRAAAEQFRALNEIEPEIMTATRANFAGANDDEICARQVMGFARSKLMDDPSRRQDVIERLDAELRDLTGAPPVCDLH